MSAIGQINLDEKTSARLVALAALQNRSPDMLMRNAIEDYLAREEQNERDKQEDEARWQRYQQSGDSVPHATARDWLTALSEGRAADCPV